MSKQRAEFVSVDEQLQKKINADQTFNALKRMRDLQTNQQSKLEIQELMNNRVVELASEKS
jgi:flagellar biosynthesis regulator FlbT